MKEIFNFHFDFEKLNVYQKSLDFIDEISKVYKQLPREFRYSLGNNLIRAGLSITNNLAEGNGKRSKKEKNRYFGTSLDSVRECISVFNVFKRQNLIPEGIYQKLRSDGRTITNMIHGLINS
ncbi:MAG: four helix bundle protein [Candidatus Omnitrophica bacterium]|nr:four helix bundle protein [Candidatus Omnitrophota bacterium]